MIAEDRRCCYRLRTVFARMPWEVGVADLITIQHLDSIRNHESHASQPDQGNWGFFPCSHR
jgi:hypothetical protein